MTLNKDFTWKIPKHCQVKEKTKDNIKQKHVCTVNRNQRKWNGKMAQWVELVIEPQFKSQHPPKERSSLISL